MYDLVATLAILLLCRVKLQANAGANLRPVEGLIVKITVSFLSANLVLLLHRDTRATNS